MALTTTEVLLLKDWYPKLHPNGDRTEIAGEVFVNAVYDAKANAFNIIRTPEDQFNGIQLSGNFTVRIEDPLTEDRFNLPRLFIENANFPFDAERHFSLKKVACLCGASEEAHILHNDYSFMTYMDTLVIPFLYAQLYYDKYDSKWPWAYYSHDTLGALESFFQKGDMTTIAATIGRIRIMEQDFPRIASILKHSDFPKGHAPCFCRNKGKIRECHTEAWEGLKKLHASFQDLKKAHPQSYARILNYLTKETISA